MSYGATKIPWSYEYEVEGHEVVVTRTHASTAYPRNGNVGAATEYFTWSSTADGEHVTSHADSRATAYEYARARILGIDYYWHPDYPARARNVRGWMKVQDEMKANYRRRIRPTG
jgi:hypothetical protein